VCHWQNQQGPEGLANWLDKAPGALGDYHQDGEMGSQESVGPRLGVKHLDVGVELQATKRQHSQETLEVSAGESADETLVDDTGTTVTIMDIAML